MKHELLVIGRTKDKFIEDGIAEYSARLSHYTSFVLRILSLKAKGRNKNSGRDAEGELLLQTIPAASLKIVLDAKGRQFSSEQFAEQIRKWEVGGVRQICYLIGGPEGHSEKVLAEADMLFSLSRMTFTHDMIRMFFVEQLYRAYTINGGEKYHK